MFLILAVGLLLASAGSLKAQKTDTVSVAVDSAQMRLVISGAGAPTVVLEAGAASDLAMWARVQKELSRDVRVVSYDRLGYGASGPAGRPRTASVMASQLREGLRSAGVQPPFLLVAHSFGGIVSRVFASTFPEETAGLVLVDPAQEDFYVRAAIDEPAAYLAQLEEDLTWAEGRATEAVRREYLAYETSLVQARLAKLSPRLRIVLLSATQMELAPELRRIWLSEQERWAAKVGAQRILIENGHRIPQQRPDAVVSAVRSLLRQ